MSAYKKKVEETSGLLYYWPLKLNSGTAAVGGINATLTNTTSGAAGQGPLESPATDEGTTLFNGTTGVGQTGEINLEKTTVTVEFFVRWTTNGTNDDFAMEFGASANENKGFNFDWNNSTGGESTAVSVKTCYGNSANARRYTFPKPTAAAWHHVVATFKAATKPVIYVDGVAQTVSEKEVTNTQTGNFGKAKLNLMCRNAASLQGEGRMDDVAIYEGELSKATVEAHYAARKEGEGGSALVVPASAKFIFVGPAAVMNRIMATNASAVKFAAPSPAPRRAASAPASAVKLQSSAAGTSRRAAPEAAALKLQVPAPAPSRRIAPEAAGLKTQAGAPAPSRRVSAPSALLKWAAGTPTTARRVSAAEALLKWAAGAPDPSRRVSAPSALLKWAAGAPASSRRVAPEAAALKLQAGAPAPSRRISAPSALFKWAAEAPGVAGVATLLAPAATIRLFAAAPTTQRAVVPGAASARLTAAAPASNRLSAPPPALLRLFAGAPASRRATAPATASWKLRALIPTFPLPSITIPRLFLPLTADIAAHSLTADIAAHSLTADIGSHSLMADIGAHSLVATIEPSPTNTADITDYLSTATIDS